MKITIKREQRQTSLELPGKSNLRDIGANTIRLLMILCCMTWLVSCNDDNSLLSEEPQTGQQIKFDISFAGENNNKLKVNTETNFTSSWQNGDKIGVYIVKGGGALLASGNYADNVEFTYSGSSWTTAAPLFYPNDGDNLSFYAYFPYDAGMSNPNAYTFNVPADQAFNNGEYYKKNDFLWAKLENIAKSDNAVALQFSHVLAMVQFSIEYSGWQNIKTILREAVTDCKIDLYTQNILKENTKNDIKMWNRFTIVSGGKSSFTCWSLIPPQTMDIRFVWEWQGTYYSASPASNVALTGGKVHKYEIQ